MGYLCQLNPYLECDGCMWCYESSEEEKETEDVNEST